MNHLAHALLAGGNDEVLLGSLLGDFWRGGADPAWPDAVRAGLVLHRNIDVYTDSHPRVAQARALFEPPWRRFAGILIDVHFDHLLACEWRTDDDAGLEAFSQRTRRILRANAAWLPRDLNRFAAYFEAHGLFAAYAERATIERVLAGIGRRLRHANPLAEAGAALWSRTDDMRRAYRDFYPQLEAFAARRRAELGA
jgi:acyl carrier protein phosphodiesterase